MFRITAILMIAAALVAGGCSGKSTCQSKEPVRVRLLTGTHDFGKGKDAKKYKRINRRGY